MAEKLVCMLLELIPFKDASPFILVFPFYLEKCHRYIIEIETLRIKQSCGHFIGLLPFRDDLYRTIDYGLKCRRAASGS